MRLVERKPRAYEVVCFRLVVFGAPLCVQVGSSGASVKLGDLREGGEAQQWRLEKGELERHANHSRLVLMLDVS